MQRHLAVLVLVAFGALACTPVPQMLAPASPDARAHIHRIGIRGPASALVTYDKPPTPGAGSGYGHGVAACFDPLKNGAPVDFLSAAVFLGMLVGCPTIGGLQGAARNPSEGELAEARAAVDRLGAETRGDALRGDLVALLARDLPAYPVALLAPDAPDGARPEPPVDTLVNLVWFQVYLMQCDTDRHTVPPLTLYAWVHAELVRVADRAVLHSARVEYWGEAVSLVAWGAGGGERLARGLARAQRSLAEQLAQSFFLAQTPTPMTWPFCKNQPWRKRWER